MIEVIDNHSVRTDLLPENSGWILDAGARGFRFARWFADRGHLVTAMDPAPDIHRPDPEHPLLSFLNVGLVGIGDAGPIHYFDRAGDPEASFLTTNETDCLAGVIDVTMLGCFHSWDVVKLNIEGSEYRVLETWPGPIAKQIVVSFHEHTERARGDAAIQKIVEHLSQWYVPVQHVKDARYCAGMNYWDSLFVLKELA